MEELILRLADATIGDTFNFYREGDGAETRRDRLLAYLRERETAPLLLVGEAAGYRGARVSGIPFTSERQLTGRGPAEASATIVHRVLTELGIEQDILLWNVVPTHPGTVASNRRPTKTEVEAGLPYLHELGSGRFAIPVGRLAHAVLGGPYIRHPSHGGAPAFAMGICHCLSTLKGRDLRPRPFVS
jgi:uracil-DNA glycosylase